MTEMDDKENPPTDCPECKNPLESHPVMWNPACFLHGDYIYTDGKWAWYSTGVNFRVA